MILPPLPSDCPATKPDGTPCRARVAPGRRYCRWHDPDPTARERHLAESRKGGEAKAYGSMPTAAPMLDDLAAGTDFDSMAGTRALLGVALHRLAALPFTERTAHALATIVSAQQRVIETHELEQRLRALEARTTARPDLRAVR